MKLLIGSCEALSLQMKPNLVSHLEFVWNSMLIMALLVTWHWISEKYHGPIIICDEYVQ
jgi:hypothetical protein